MEQKIEKLQIKLFVKYKNKAITNAKHAVIITLFQKINTNLGSLPMF